MTRAWWLVALPLIAGCLEGTTGADVPPIAVATVGDGACALPGVTEVVLDATGSSGPAGQPLAFAWQFVEVPAGASPQLTDPTTATPRFVPPVAGTYRLTVTVTAAGKSTESAPVAVIADERAPSITIVSGDGQTEVVDNGPRDPLVVEVDDACGAPVAGATVTWRGDGARADHPVVVTDALGRAETEIWLGMTAGEHEVVASLDDGTSATFTVIAEPDEPFALLVADLGGSVPASATTPVLVGIRVVDRQLNPTGTDTTFAFGIAIAAGPDEAHFDDDADGDCTDGGPRQLSGLTTTAGAATVGLCGPVAGDVYLDLVLSPSEQLEDAGLETTYLFDGEADAPEISTAPPWARGEPAPVPGVGFHGAVYATELTGPAPAVTSRSHADLVLTAPAIDPPLGQVYEAWLVHDQVLRLGVDDDGCPRTGHVLQGTTPLAPRDEYPAGAPCDGLDAAWVGASVGRHEARYLVDPAGASTFTWRLGYGAGSDAAAWYVDDIRYVRVAEFPRVRFVAP